VFRIRSTSTPWYVPVQHNKRRNEAPGTGRGALSRPLVQLRPRDGWNELHVRERSENMIGRQDESDPSLIHIVCDIKTEDPVAEILPAFDLQSDTCRRMEMLTAESLALVPHGAGIEEERRAQFEKPETQHGEHAVFEIEQYLPTFNTARPPPMILGREQLPFPKFGNGEVDVCRESRRYACQKTRR